MSHRVTKSVTFFSFSRQKELQQQQDILSEYLGLNACFYTLFFDYILGLNICFYTFLAIFRFLPQALNP